MINISNKLYDTLKFIASIVLPATSSLYFALANIWNLPFGEEVVGTIAVITTFLGTLLQISSKSYYKEVINIE